MEIKKSVEKFIREKAQLRYPNEACGFIVAKGNKSIPVEAENEAENPRYQFLMNPTAWADASEVGEIVAVWHTHVNEPAVPSEADIVGCNDSELPWLLMSIHESEQGKFMFSKLTSFTPTDYVAEYEGRPYVYGIFDCWSLVVDYYSRNLGIKLNNNYPRLKEFWKNGKPLFSDHYKDEGLKRVTDETYKDGDIFMFQTDSSGEISHVGVYIGDGKFLHHVQGRLSKIDIYGGYWLTHTVLHLRHESKC